MKVFVGVLILTVLTLSTSVISESVVQAAINQFSMEMYKSLSKKPNENVFFSPISTHLALSLLYQGAKGSTKELLTNALHVSNPSSAADGYEQVMDKLHNVTDSTLSLANRIYFQYGYAVKPDFEDIASNKFQSRLEFINFGQTARAAETINSWVNEETHGKISLLFEEGDFNNDTKMILINALYFKDEWVNKFDHKKTSAAQFYVNSEKNVEVNTMKDIWEIPYKNCSNLDAQIVELPYKSQNFSMVIILPHKRDGITDLENVLLNSDFSEITEGLEEKIVSISLPRFKLESSMDLRNTFKDIGLAELYEDPDLSGLLEDPEPLKISKAIQMAYIEVSEEGSAVSNNIGLASNEINDQETFKVNHPFIFLVKSEENIIFFGKILEPDHH